LRCGRRYRRDLQRAGVFSGVEIILREFSVEPTFTMMLSAMVADLIGHQFAASAPFLAAFLRRRAASHVQLPAGVSASHRVCS